jgi:2-hydroxy-6-oxonona-2,4-dienedioate hydrolase
MNQRNLWSDLRGVSFSQGWLDAGGWRVRYLHAGNPSNPTLLLLHGLGDHAEAFARNLGAHAGYFSVWAIDLPGHGWSQAPSQLLSITDHADHIVRFLDAVVVPQAHLSGYSLGGCVAAAVSLRHPRRVRRLAIVDAALDAAAMRAVHEGVLRAARNPTLASIAARLKSMIASRFTGYDDLVEAELAIYSQPGWWQSLEQGWLALAASFPAFEAIRVPSLVVRSDAADSPAAGVPGALSVALPGNGNWPQFSSAERFNRLHVDFLLGRPLFPGSGI